MKMNKKGQIFGALQGLGIGLASMVIVFAVVFLIMGQVKTNSLVAANGNATASTNTLISATAGIPGWVPIVVVTSIGGLLIMLVAGFGRRS